jgi:hypothetical protein
MEKTQFLLKKLISLNNCLKINLLLRKRAHVSQLELRPEEWCMIENLKNEFLRVHSAGLMFVMSLFVADVLSFSPRFSAPLVVLGSFN